MSSGNPWKKSGKSKRKAKSVFRGRGGNLDAQRKEFNAYEFLCRQQEIKEWIQECIGEEIAGTSVSNFIQTLRNGVYLCKLSNSVAPGSVPKIHENAKMEFQYTENISHFLQACTKLGLPKTFLFSVPDLWEQKNSLNVVDCIHAFSNFLDAQGLAPKMKSLQGKIEFNEEELKKANEELKKIAETQPKPAVIVAPEPDEVFAEPERTEVIGEGSETSVAGELTTFTLRSKDTNGKSFDTGGDSFSVILTHKTTGAKHTANVLDKDDGSYTVSYNLTQAGDYFMDITMDDIPIREQPFDVLVLPGDKTKGANCTIEGTGSHGSVAGTEATFIIQTKDKFNNNRITGGDDIKVNLKKQRKEDSEGVKCEVVDFENGKYSVTYNCPESGLYDLNITVNDELLQICPLYILVRDLGISDATQCSISGEDMHTAVAGKPKKLILQAKDKFGNARETGGEDFISILTHTTAGHIIDVDIRDVENGTYELTFAPTDASEYELEVMLGDAVVAGTPFNILVLPQNKSSAQACSVSGDGLASGVAGEENTFIIHSRDKFGNARKEGGEQFKVSITHSEDPSVSLESTIKDLQNGQYEVKYTATKSGDYNILVQHYYIPPTEEERKAEEAEKKRVRRSSRRMSQDISQKEAALLSSLAQAETEESEAKKREQELLALLGVGPEDSSASTSNNNEAVEKQPEASTSASARDEIPIISISSEGSENSSAKPTSSEDSAPTSPSADSLTEHWETVSGKGYVSKIKDAGETTPENCSIDLSGVSSVISGEEAYILIRAKDKFGNFRKEGGEKFSASMFHKKTGNKLATMVQDLGDGTYKISFTPKDWGDYHMDVKLKKNKVGDTLLIHVAEPASIRSISNDEFVKLSDFDLMRTLKAEAEDDKGDDIVIEKIQTLKENVIKQIRENNVLEKDLKKLDRKIELLIKNRVTLQEVMMSSKGINKFMNKLNKNKGGKGSAQGQGTVLEDKKKLEAYSNLFYLLQTEPSYLARCVFLVTDQVDAFLETVILTLYGYAFSPREEYLILNLFKMSLEYEVSSSGTVGGFLETNPIVTKMVLAYCSRLQGKEFLREVLVPMIKNVLQDVDLNLEINPTKVLKDMITSEESKTGVKSTIKASEINDEFAVKDPKVKAVLEHRINQLTQKCDMFISGIIAAKEKLPYGLRWISKTLSVILKKQYPDSSEEAIINIIAYLVYYRFMNPVIIQPDDFNVSSGMIPPTTRRNLILIAKVLQGLTNNTVFGTSSTLEKFMDVMNPFITQNYPRVFNFFKEVCSVGEPEEFLGVHKYVDLTQKMAPTISISINEMLSTHRTILSFEQKLAAKEDDPLRLILKQLGNPSDPVPEDLNEEMNLPLINAFEKDVEKSEISPLQVYEETKELVRRTLRIIPVENFFPSLSETLEKSKKWAQAKLKKADPNTANNAAADSGTKKQNTKKQQTGDDDDEEDGHDWADEEDNEKEMKLDVDPDILYKNITKIMENLQILENANLVNKSKDDYASLLKDIAGDARNRTEHRARQKKELDRLEATIKELVQHSNFLKEQNDNFVAYLEDVKDKSTHVPGKKKRGKKSNQSTKIGPFKYTVQQLEKKGVILSIDVPAGQSNKVKFSITSEHTGVFDVAAQLAGITLKTIQLELDDLLEKQYNGVEKLDFEYVTLDLNMTVHLLNRLTTKV